MIIFGFIPVYSFFFFLTTKVNYSVVENGDSRSKRNILRSSSSRVAEFGPGPATLYYFASDRYCPSTEELGLGIIVLLNTAVHFLFF